MRNGFLDQIVSNAKANVDVSLSGARLVASALTDFRSVMDKKSRGEPQDAKVDLIVKIEDVIVKVIQSYIIIFLFKKRLWVDNSANFGFNPILQLKR